MSYTNQKVPSPILSQRNFAYAINQFPARSPILGGRDISENESDDASVTNSTTAHHGMSRGNATGRSNPWQPPTTSRKPLTAMARPGPERQLSSSPEYTPASPSFATAGSTHPRSPVFAARNPNFNPNSSGPSNALYAHYQAQPQSPTSGPYLPDYQSPGMNYQEHFTSYRAKPENSFAVQPPPMLPSLTSNFFRDHGSMNNSNSSRTHSNISRRKRLSEEDDDFFAPPSKRRHYSFGFYNETTARATEQTLQNSRNRVYVSGNYGTTHAGGDVEMNNHRAPQSSNIYAGMVHQAAPSTPRGRAADDYNGPLATFPGDIEYTTTETAYGPNYSGEPGLVIQQKPTSPLACGTSSFDSAVATKPNHLPQILPRLPPLGTMFSGLSSIQSPQTSPPSSNNDYPTKPQDNINHDNILSPTPQRSIRAEVFHSLEARDASVDPLILHSYAPSPALSEGSTHDAENQNSNGNPPVERPQEENPINRHDTDSVTLAEDTPRQSIEVPDDTDNESVVSHHSRNNNDDDNESVISHHSRNNNDNDNNNQLLILQEEVTDLGVELYGVQRELSNHGGNFGAFYTLNTEYSTEIPTISGNVERLERRIQAQSDETTQLRNEINTLKAEASEHQSQFDTFMDLVVEVADQSNLHGEQINQLTQREARAQIEIANNATANKVDELAALTREITRLQNRVLTLQNEALEKQIAELLRASSGL
ncbi:hypothetical protein BOTNAR_0515g00010 [Botryotinia narcissicola]|uniref:Uncharacterized protein n=1 Tax=Botryotinia narcissicola TaxID=278944 RepID=A0A4Z1HEM7_9HELO|nr:hypothetical protein BOTNAR_0515g00010 [Botryotinia narcissicola]